MVKSNDRKIRGRHGGRHGKNGKGMRKNGKGGSKKVVNNGMKISDKVQQFGMESDQGFGLEALNMDKKVTNDQFVEKLVNECKEAIGKNNSKTVFGNLEEHYKEGENFLHDLWLEYLESGNVKLQKKLKDIVLEFDDIRMWSLVQLEEILSENLDEGHLVLDRILEVIPSLTPPPLEGSEFILDILGFDIPSQYVSMDYQKKVYTNFWVTVLQLKGLEPSHYEQILGMMNDYIIPNFSNPFLLNDFIHQSFNMGGKIALLSVQSLFTLISKHNLIFPDFYQRLYTILHPDLFLMQERAQFFRFLSLALQSSHVTASIIASFVKKLSRMALFLPSFAIEYVLVFILHVMYEFKDLRSLVHKVDEEFEKRKLMGRYELSQLPEFVPEILIKEDPFRMEETDVDKTGALQSSLWELSILEKHHNESIRNLITSIRKTLRKGKVPKYTIIEAIEKDFNDQPDLEALKQSAVHPRRDLEWQNMKLNFV